MDWTEMVELVGCGRAIIRYAARFELSRVPCKSDQERGRRNGPWNAVVRQVWGGHGLGRPEGCTPDGVGQARAGVRGPLPSAPARTPAIPCRRAPPETGPAMAQLERVRSKPRQLPPPVVPAYLPPTAPNAPLRVGRVGFKTPRTNR